MPATKRNAKLNIKLKHMASQSAFIATREVSGRKKKQMTAVKKQLLTLALENQRLALKNQTLALEKLMLALEKLMLALENQTLALENPMTFRILMNIELR